MSFARDLLEQSRHLASREPKRPRQASLRRAVSTAYYALFHLLITAAVANWKKVHQRAALARAFEHKRMKVACGRVKESKFPNPNHVNVVHLKNVAKAFIRLQEERHNADYDNSKKWSRTEVLAHIDTATAAFNSWNIIGNDPIAEDFLLQLFIQR
jgi:uncharacterized protein (UPF0332 family)